jgi:aspartyl-tRNA(Asn)/glutamyl-tRNA(Gln) amidotransferase subunit A
MEATLERIDKLNPSLNSYITVLYESAREEARKADSMIKKGEYRGPLHGMPISLKDLIYIKGIKSTSGSKILADFVPNYDSMVVTKLRQAGAIIIGTNNTHEFACGITNVNPHFGSTRNPWETTRMSGGSSGGSAVSVSAGMCAGSIGTDTSGSIRVPSSLCGLFGLKPTYGRVSKFGVMPLAPSIDHVGPITRSPWDAACILQFTAGYDENDSSTADLPVPDYLSGISKRTGRFGVGIPRQFFFDLIDPRVRKVFDEFVDKIARCDISSVPVNVDHTDKILDTWRAFRLGESAATHEEWIRTRSEDYGKDVITMLRKGLEITAVHYINAHKWRDEIRQSLVKAMEGLDALLVPTTVIPAPRLDQDTIEIGGRTVEVYPTLSRLTTVFDVTGLPVLNIPAGLVDGKLPVGVQLVGRPFDEERLFQIAEAYEQRYQASKEMIPKVVAELVQT